MRQQILQIGLIQLLKLAFLVISRLFKARSQYEKWTYETNFNNFYDITRKFIRLSKT